MKAYLIGNIQYFLNRLAFLLVLAVVLFMAYFFYMPSINIFGNEIINPFYSYFEYLSWWLHFMSFITVISSVIVIIFLFASFYFNIRKQRVEKKEKQYEDRFTKKMIAYLYSDFLLNDTKQEEYFNFFDRLTNSRMSSEILFIIIVRIQKLIDEDFRKKFNELLDNTRLRDRMEYLLYSNNISEKIIALKVISYLGVKDYNKRISRYINSRNYALRNEAIIAYVRLSDTNNLDFLLSQKYHISKLGINEIINAVGGNLKEDRLDYEKLIKSSTTTRVNVAGVMLVKDRNRSDYKELIKGALKDDDRLLREVAWDVYATIGKTDSDLDFMITRFADESHENKINILKSLRDFDQDERLLAFLDKVIINESLLLKIYALRLLFEKNMSRLFVYQRMGDDRISLACREVADFNII